VTVRSISQPLSSPFDGRRHKSRSVTVSEQRRPLLLPQEVQALGGNDAIVFYEGLPPIRCKKLRYFKDARFRARIRPAPKWAAPNRPSVPSWRAVPPSVDESMPPESETRAATAADFERIDELTLEDLGVKVAPLAVPRNDAPMTQEELDAAVNAFIASFKASSDAGRGPS
jgi:type IV secretion system protein VirD4